MYRWLRLPLAVSLLIIQVQFGYWLYAGQQIDIYTLMTFTTPNYDESAGFLWLLLTSHPLLLSWVISALGLAMFGIRRAKVIQNAISWTSL